MPIISRNEVCSSNQLDEHPTNLTTRDTEEPFKTGFQATLHETFYSSQQKLSPKSYGCHVWNSTMPYRLFDICIFFHWWKNVGYLMTCQYLSNIRPHHRWMSANFARKKLRLGCQNSNEWVSKSQRHLVTKIFQIVSNFRWRDIGFPTQWCWCICNFGMYSSVYLMYCTPMFIMGCVCNVFESCHAPMFLSGGSIM